MWFLNKLLLILNRFFTNIISLDHIVGTGFIFFFAIYLKLVFPEQGICGVPLGQTNNRLFSLQDFSLQFN